MTEVAHWGNPPKLTSPLRNQRRKSLRNQIRHGARKRKKDLWKEKPGTGQGNENEPRGAADASEDVQGRAPDRLTWTGRRHGPGQERTVIRTDLSRGVLHRGLTPMRPSGFLGFGCTSEEESTKFLCFCPCDWGTTWMLSSDEFSGWLYNRQKRLLYSLSSGNIACFA